MKSKKGSDYLYIFLHIPRTAGTTLVKHIEGKFKPEERLRLYRKELKLEKVKKKHLDFEDYNRIAKQHILKLSESQKNKIKVIYGHRVPYGIHKLFKKKARYITIVRGPLARAVSMYNFWTTSYMNEDSKGKKRKVFRNGYLVKGKKPEFESWVTNRFKEDNIDTMGVSMVRFFQKLGYIKSKSIRSEPKEVLSKFFFIGLTESFNEDSLFLYKLLGVKRFYSNLNVSKIQVVAKGNIDYKFLSKYYKDDTVLYKRAKEINQKYTKGNVFYKKAVEEMKYKRRFYFPITQFVDQLTNLKR